MAIPPDPTPPDYAPHPRIANATLHGPGCVTAFFGRGVVHLAYPAASAHHIGQVDIFRRAAFASLTHIQLVGTPRPKGPPLSARGILAIESWLVDVLRSCKEVEFSCVLLQSNFPKFGITREVDRPGCIKYLRSITMRGRDRKGKPA